MEAPKPQRMVQKSGDAPAPTPFVESAAEEALRIVRGNREGVYGKPTKNFDTIAKLWTAYLQGRPDDVSANLIRPIDVAYLMVLMKTARLANCPTHRDSVVDIVGYSDCADLIQREMGQ